MARIVVVDDSEIVVEVCKAWLESGGHSVKTVRNPLLAPMIVQRQDAELVLIDVQMPIVQGPRVVVILRSVAPHAKLVLYSSLERAELVEKVRECRADGFVQKTDDSVQFLAEIDRLLA